MSIRFLYLFCDILLIGYYGGANTDIGEEYCRNICPDITYNDLSCYECPYEELCEGKENCKTGYNGTLCLEVLFVN